MKCILRGGHVFLLLCAGLCLGGSVVSYRAYDGLWLRHGDYDAGRVAFGHVIAHNVYLINLSLYSVAVTTQPSCGCTVVDQKPYVVAPFKSLTYHVAVDAASHLSGIQRKDVTFYCDDGSHSWTQSATIRFRTD